VAKAGKKNIFSGRILEIEGLPDLKVEQAFELSDASAERSAAGCTIKLNKAPIIEYLTSNVVLMKNMIADGYQDARTLERRIEKVEAWLANPQLLEADKDAEYAAVIEIDLAELKEPVLCCPNDPDDAKLLSEVAGTKIDEAFIGSVHDQHRPLPRRGQAAGRQARHPGQAVGGAADQDGPERADQGRPLRRLRHRRRAHRDAGLQPVHGQPGAGARRRHRGLDQHPQLPQPPGQEHQRVPGLGRTGGHRQPSWAASRRWPSTTPTWA
jgi:aconitate hydratase 2 / 2-methylisocitrate dehydratase